MRCCCSRRSAAASRRGSSNDVPATMASLSAFNRWLEDDWGFHYRGRLIGVPMLSLADPDAALAEVGSLIERGARIVHVRPAPVPTGRGRGRSLGDRLHDRVWATLAEAGIPVAFHLGDSGYNSFAGAWGSADTFEAFGGVDVLSRLVVSDRAIHDTIGSLVIDGVFHRHPKLRVASIENGSDWLHLAREAPAQAFQPDPVGVPRGPARHRAPTRLGDALSRGRLARARRSDRRRADPVRIRLAPRRGRRAPARLRQGALALQGGRGPPDHARELSRAARGADQRMDFALSEEQELLQDTVRSFVAKECPPKIVRAIFDGERAPVPALWNGLAEIGIAGLAIPEALRRRGTRAARPRARRRRARPRRGARPVPRSRARGARARARRERGAAERPGCRGSRRATRARRWRSPRTTGAGCRRSGASSSRTAACAAASSSCPRRRAPTSTSSAAAAARSRSSKPEPARA